MSAHPKTWRWLRRIGIALGIVVVLIVIGLWWLLGTTSGLHFALDRVESMSHGAITIKASSGHLAGPLQLDDIHYRDQKSGMRAHIGHITADIDLASILAGRIHFTQLDINGVNVALVTPAQPPPKKSTKLSLKPPVNVVLDQAHVSDIHITRDGKPLFVANTLDLAGSWTSNGLTLRQLRLRAPEGHAELAGEVSSAKGHRGKGQGSFKWTLKDTTWAGKLDAQSNGQRTQLALTLTSPMTATLRLNVQQTKQAQWTAKLTAPKFNTAPLIKSSSIKTLALALAGHGDRNGGTLTGNIDVNQTRFELQPLVINYDSANKQVELKQLVLTSPQIKGALTGHGTIDLAAEPAHADLALTWRDVVLPADLAGQELASAGDLTLVGSSEKYHVKGRVTIGPPGQLAHLKLDVDGTPQVVTLEELTVEQPKGQLATHGTITLKPAMAWDLTVTGKNFNPGLLLAGWNGALNLDLATQGTLTPKGPDASFTLATLSGKLRERTLSGKGKLHVNPERVINGTMHLASGHSRIDLTATGTHSNHADLKLAIATLNDWLPDASGAVNGDVKLTGLWPKLAVTAHVTGSKLALGERRVGRFTLNADVPDLSHPGGTLKLDAGNLSMGQIAFKTVRVRGKGNAAHHELTMSANGQPLSVKIALTGAMKNKVWNGTLSTLDLDVEGIPPWRLQKPAQLAWNHGKASISQTCLTAGKPVLCLSGDRTQEGAVDANYRLREIPLALITSAVGSKLSLRGEGVINGEGHIHRDASGKLTGHATLVSPRGRIMYSDRPDLPLLAYDNLNINANLAPERQHITLAADFSHGGNLRGNVDITGPQQALSGVVDMRLDSLAPIELFTSAVANVKGRLDGHFQLGGTIKQPALQGQARLAGFAAEVPAAGLKLHDGEVKLATTGAKQARLTGHIASGNGTLNLGGTLGLGAGETTHITLRGDKVLAANIPAAKVTLSPNLAIEKNTKGLGLTGTVTVDKAEVNLEKLPGAGPHVVQASPDVVVVDETKEEEKKQAALPITADITVNLDDHTHLVGYGLDGHVSGELNVRQSPGKVTTGRGQIAIDGTYKAYGQDLIIQHGQLLFASTPIENPGLDIRAVRKLHPNATISDNQVVGLQISGTAQRPVLTIFSNPPMEQSDALAYLITGKPLSQVSGGEGNAINSAAQALGSAAGNLLAKGIGSKLGIEAGVSSSEALGTAAFTVGKYLSPRLYLSYGVGLFNPGQVITLRYLLSQHWNFEAEQATDFSRASFNYRIEK